MKKAIFVFFFCFISIGTIFAIENFLKAWNNWDANVATHNNVNDIFNINGRLDLEDSRSVDYSNWYRWRIIWKIFSDLYWEFDTFPRLDLYFKSNTIIPTECWDSLEVYSVEWKILSKSWWEMTIDNTNSFFCSNQYLYIVFNSAQLWNKEIWSEQWALVDNFWKQSVWILGISRIKWDVWDGILSRGDEKINNLWVSISAKTLFKKNIDKNISTLYKTYNDYIVKNVYNINSFDNTDQENLYLYDYNNKTQSIYLKNSIYYKNKWKIFQIWNNWNWKTWIDWKHTVIVKSWNVYINSNIYNNDDEKDLLTIISKKWTNWNWWNIYINPNVTNIDAVLIADWSLISLLWDHLQLVDDSSQLNNLRKQLLIYGSVFSYNNIWNNKIPYWADLYWDSSYINWEMEWNIYDLWNLRTFNLNYWENWKNCTDWDKVAPIDWYWNYVLNAWAWRKNCYSDDIWEQNLRTSNKKNSLIIEYNSNINNINPIVLKD